jgi:hypothetical protein
MDAPAVSMQDVHRDQLSFLLLSDRTTVYWGILSISSRILASFLVFTCFWAKSSQHHALYPTPFEVIIVGGGIAGLAIANGLEKAGKTRREPRRGRGSI